MKTAIFNRQFQHPADGWYQVETPGEHANEKAGVVQVIDGTAVASMVNRFNQEAADYAAKNDAPFPGMLIDIEHFKHDADKETRAYGWLLEMQNRNGVPFGKINWTGVGKPAVDGGEYRFFSSEYDPKDVQILSQAGTPRVRPLRLDGLTLTNQPNNKGGRPITNRAVIQDTWTEKGKQAFQRLTEQLADPSLSPQQKNTLQQMADNIVASEKATAERNKSAAADAKDFSRPDFEKWLRAVVNVQDMVKKNGGAFDFNRAWDMAKQQYPEIYAAAFGNQDGETDPQVAGDQFSELTNRIKSAAGWDFAKAWNFTRYQAPNLYNRMTAPQVVAKNRDADVAKSTQATQIKASNLWKALAETEKQESGGSFDCAWDTIRNRHPGLSMLACGRITEQEAFAREPALRNRLT